MSVWHCGSENTSIQSVVLWSSSVYILQSCVND